MGAVYAHPYSELPEYFIIIYLGTVTNGKALMNFKVGGFVPGVPIQPVLLRSSSIKDPSNEGGYRKVGLDTLTWTFNTNFHPAVLFWLTLCQIRSHFIVRSYHSPSCILLPRI